MCEKLVLTKKKRVVVPILDMVFERGKPFKLPEKTKQGQTYDKEQVKSDLLRQGFELVDDKKNKKSGAKK